MDYKEKYTREEALREVRGFMGQLTEGCQAAIESLIPELRESEDERIRKWLVDYFTEIGENWIHREFTCEQIVAYLEKQKEQKSINSFDIVPYIDDKIAALQDMWREEKVAFDWDDMHEMIEDVARHFYQKEQNSPDSTGLYYYDGKKFTCCGFPYNFTMNQQEEQKTVAISENNNSDANGHLTGKILVEYGAHAKVRDGKRHCEMDWKEFQRLAHYFYELGKTEQKPAGWSEEDDKAAYFINQFLEYHETSDPTAKSCKEWFNSRLKSLRPQPKQEWSEEDENALEYLHELIGFGFTEKFFDAQTAADMRGWLNTRLKSLRPSWKPARSRWRR